MESDLVEGAAVSFECAFVLGRSVDIVEHPTGQPLLRNSSEVIGASGSCQSGERGVPFEMPETDGGPKVSKHGLRSFPVWSPDLEKSTTLLVGVKQATWARRFTSSGGH